MVRDIFNKVTRELENQYPGYVKSFNHPASKEQIAAYEQLIGRPLPADLKELYECHNGQERQEKYGLEFFFSLPFITIEESMEQWKFLNQQLGDTSSFDINVHSIPADYIREQYINAGWIPISKDSGGNYIGIDINPDVKGTPGQVINFGRDENTKYVIASGVKELLEFMLGLVQQKRLTILAQDDDDADEEEDDDGNLLPLPKVYRFAIDGQVIWHFLDWLKVLDLPKSTLNDSEKNYHTWLDTAPEAWKALANANCNFQGLGFAHPARIVRFYPGKLPVPDLKYIHYFKNLREVILSGTALTDLSPLQSLSLIKILFLSSSAVKNLDALKNLKRLRQLFLNKLKIHDLSPLQDLALEALNIEGSEVTNLEVIGNIKSLKELDISNTAIRSADPLTRLEHLNTLNISGTGITDLSFVDKLKSLKELKIFGLHISDYEPFIQKKKLTQITCSFAVAKELKKHLTHPVDFTIQGEMTPNEKEEWRAWK